MIRKKCGECFYFCSKDESEEGECRKYSPRIVLGQICKCDIVDSDIAIWPIVKNNEWCGEWIPTTDDVTS